MKKIILFIAVITSPLFSIASHLAGGHMEYECLGDNQYRVRLVFFRDCDGLNVGEDDGPILTLESATCGTPCIDLGQMDYVSDEVVDYGCGNTCLFGSLPGFEKWVFEKTFTLNTQCPDWKASIVISARNNTDYAGGGSYYNYVLINNENGMCNNSPVFNDMSIWLGCLNTVSSFPNSFTESEGDDVQFEITSPLNFDLNGSACSSENLTFLNGLTFTNPFPSSAPFVVNPNTGASQFTPNQQGTSYFGIKVSEYRNGILVSETIRDGEIIVSACSPTSDLNLGNWSGENSHDISVYPAQDSCFTIPVSSTTPILEVLTSGFPSANFNVSVSGIGSTNATIFVCPIWESFSGFCDPLEYNITVNSSSEIPECFSDAGGVSSGYSFTILPVDYCPEYRFFTNRNPGTGLGMPTFAKASKEIWVGDYMPPQSQIPPIEWGDVIYSGDVTLEAGEEIIIPSCVGGPNVLDCVVLSGSETFIIKPFNCSQECTPIPLEIEVTNIFDCGDEHVLAEVLSGTPPFTFAWTNVNGTLLSNSNTLDVHSYVSTHLWDDGLEYNLYVEDAAGFVGQFSGEAHGTKRFYQPLYENMFGFPDSTFEVNKWTCYPDNILGDIDVTYLYDGNFGVHIDYPMVIWDGINNTPPWYGATKLDFTVYNQWGGIVVEKIVDLEGTDDWSLDNYEFYWDGTLNNSGDPNNCTNSPWDVFEYTVEAGNCQTTPHCEQGIIVYFNCYQGDWNDSVWETKGPSDSNYGGIVFENGRTNYPSEELNDTNFEVDVYPNPSNNIIQVNGKNLTINLIQILDAHGSKVISSEDLSIDISKLARGTYHVKVYTSEGIEVRKLVVN